MALNPNDATEVVPYLTSAATIVMVQKWLKTLQVYARFVEAFPGADRWAHWLVALVASLIAAAGIHIVWTGTFTEGGVATFNVPGVWAMVHGLGDWFKVFILQHTVYESTHQVPYVPAAVVDDTKKKE